MPKNNIKEARKAAGFKTQQALADKLGYSVESVKDWEQGKHLPEVSMLCRLADLLHCSTDYLLGRIDYKTVDNQYISEMTGLSDESIEVLKYCVRSGQRNEFSRNNLAGLNYILGLVAPHLPTPEQEEQDKGFPFIVNTILADIYEYVFSDSVEISAYSLEQSQFRKCLRNNMQAGGHSEAEIQQQLKLFPERIEDVFSLSFKSTEKNGTIYGSNSVTVTAKRLYQQYVLGNITKYLQRLREEEQEKQEGKNNGNME